MKRNQASAGGPDGHLYTRISDAQQRPGGGLERQRGSPAADFCRDFGFTLSPQVLVDDGVSAFNGLNASPGHALGKFVLEAQAGLIPPGDALIVENWDRISRQNPWAAISLVNDLRQLGIHIGRLDRWKLLRADSTDHGDFLECAMELLRGNSESAAKQMRNSAAWERKRRAARDEGRPLTAMLPGWVRRAGTRLELIPERVAALERIFVLAAEGRGVTRIMRALTAEGFPAWGARSANPKARRQARADRWTRPYVAALLRDRRVLGEYQPRKVDKQPVGPVIPDYFPRAISEDLFERAAAGRVSDTAPVRQGKHLNLFPSQIRDARSGLKYFAGTKSQRMLISKASVEGTGRAYGFPLLLFEEVMLREIKEVDVQPLLSAGGSDDDATALRGRLTLVEEEIAEVRAYMRATKFSPTLGERITELEAEVERLVPLLRQARQRAAHPLSETWGTVQSLAGLLEGATDRDEMRLRIRAELLRAVSDIWLLVVPRGRERWAVVQAHFHGLSLVRRFIIRYVSGAPKGADKPQAASWVDVLGSDDFDLREGEDVKAIEVQLLRQR